MGALLLGQAGSMQLTQNRGSTPLGGTLIAPGAILSPDVCGGKRKAADHDPDKKIIKTHANSFRGTQNHLMLIGFVD
jgi:hypothetical protein